MIINKTVEKNKNQKGSMQKQEKKPKLAANFTILHKLLKAQAISNMVLINQYNKKNFHPGHRKTCKAHNTQEEVNH